MIQWNYLLQGIDTVSIGRYNPFHVEGSTQLGDRGETDWEEQSPIDIRRGGLTQLAALGPKGIEAIKQIMLRGVRPPSNEVITDAGALSKVLRNQAQEVLWNEGSLKRGRTLPTDFNLLTQHLFDSRYGQALNSKGGSTMPAFTGDQLAGLVHRTTSSAPPRMTPPRVVSGDKPGRVAIIHENGETSVLGLDPDLLKFNLITSYSNRGSEATKGKATR